MIKMAKADLCTFFSILSATRKGPEGYSVVSQTWYVVITGAITKEVPNFYPVASDPTLIFTVLRDPPGGGSFTTMAQGTSISFGLQIAGMHAYDNEMSYELMGELGLQAAMGKCVGLLAMACDESFTTNTVATSHQQWAHQVATERSSSASYDYTFTFHVELATSADPNIAGHAR